MEKSFLEHVKEQEVRMSQVLAMLEATAANLDAPHENGICTAAYMDYDEQDCFNAVHIFYHVLSNYGIKHGYVRKDNVNALGKEIRLLCQKFGIDTFQEAKVKQQLNNLPI